MQNFNISYHPNIDDQQTDDEDIYRLPQEQEDFDRMMAQFEIQEPLPLVPVPVMNADEMRMDVEDRRQNSTCVICLGRTPTVVHIPCGHVCLCDDCADAFKDNICPICKGTIESKMNLRE